MMDPFNSTFNLKKEIRFCICMTDAGDWLARDVINIFFTFIEITKQYCAT